VTAKLYGFAVRISKFLVLPCAFGIAAMALVIAADVGRRFIFGKSLIGAYETVELLMVGVVYLALASTQWKKDHIRVEVVTGQFSPRTQEILECVVLITLFAFTCIMFWEGWLGFYQSWKVREYRFGFVPFPVYPSKFFIPLGMAAFALQLLADFFVAVRKIAKR
jgi:TRAP-type C4-dicarboxylate transport system permease small subunit